MASIKPSVPKGTRDFSPAEMAKRNFIFDTIKGVFRKYGYQQIETPSMENLSTLTGKYGDEGDMLIFKILDSGEAIEKAKSVQEFEGTLSALASPLKFAGMMSVSTGGVAIATQASNDLIAAYKQRFSTKNLLPQISEKALRYDLTVPFARYVVQHQNEITFPFKRFQVQPVWRADRPQKGRYREFYQCDADVVGSPSLLNEAEFIMIYDEALSLLGLKDFSIKINNRKILSGIAQVIDKHDNIIDMTVAIDKLDKIGFDGVVKELLERGFTQVDIDTIKPIILLEGSNDEKLASLRSALQNSEIGLKGCDEIQTVFDYVAACKPLTAKLELDITLARGLNYYTGAIFEVKTNEVAMGSIGGGGRYDDLTGMFGLKGLTGAGISFGADRIYDVLEELNLFPQSAEQSTQVLICCFDEQGEKYGLPLLQSLRNQNTNAELYPAGAKIKKQMEYANNKQIPYTVLIGSDEMESGLLTFKNMESGEQEKLSVNDILKRVKK
ncbi:MULTISPECIES: histidine--tRNA ligase [unclassified Mucilaginibacter]|uniref:histidine--tRNA ligase n=1 Tax=unclassified Mucilaginibacter TaxID=2617802 RepID=UPI002AC8BAE7|nr:MULTISPECIES: histidine--tRNA ligase [unclassified Mucilaginibacter]MEB0263480.1 histidine--tRNA ligase [Mucilaginibacter sp. 10I4]MEB0279652.1 histidine--tRNA ligase [Mucilaginibacter sp. 10B2]MEB0302371.1 histidine--tRNA ligase [Mucilaginibacter sp. 5C4]WPX23788.1 histidine--tRNA ligase [Mucilaginibacter sp. 5C4]